MLLIFLLTCSFYVFDLLDLFYSFCLLAQSCTCFDCFTFRLYFTGNTYVTHLLTWRYLLLILYWLRYFTFSGSFSFFFCITLFCLLTFSYLFTFILALTTYSIYVCGRACKWHFFVFSDPFQTCFRPIGQLLPIYRLRVAPAFYDYY